MSIESETRWFYEANASKFIGHLFILLLLLLFVCESTRTIAFAMASPFLISFSKHAASDSSLPFLPRKQITALTYMEVPHLRFNTNVHYSARCCCFDHGRCRPLSQGMEVGLKLGSRDGCPRRHRDLSSVSGSCSLHTTTYKWLWLCAASTNP